MTEAKSAVVAGYERGPADMVWRDLCDTVQLMFNRGKLTPQALASLRQYLAVEIDLSSLPVRIRLARLPRPVAINIPASLLSGGVREAMKRGTDQLNALTALYETGADEDLATDEWARGAAIRWDVLKRRAFAQIAWNDGLGARLMLLKARSMEGRP